MTPVYQDRFGARDGNCFAACIASLLDLPLSEVPNFAAAGDADDWWWYAAICWLAERGWWVRTIASVSAVDDDEHVSEDTLYILGVPSTIHEGLLHAVIGRRVGRRWRIVHDPNPGSAATANPVDVFHLVRYSPFETRFAWSARELDENGEPVWSPLNGDAE